jgi:hypothetical protein
MSNKTKKLKTFPFLFKKVTFLLLTNPCTVLYSFDQMSRYAPTVGGRRGGEEEKKFSLLPRKDKTLDQDKTRPRWLPGDGTARAVPLAVPFSYLLFVTTGWSSMLHVPI